MNTAPDTDGVIDKDSTEPKRRKRRRPNQRRVWKSIRWYAGYLDYLARRICTGLWCCVRRLVTRPSNRCWSDLLAGVPALLVLLCVPGLLWLMALENQAGTRTVYQQEGLRALQQGDFVTAEVCFQRLSAEDSARQEYRFRLALAVKGLGQDAHAAALVNRLAPDDRAGYAPAHHVRALQLVTKAADTPAALRAATVQLEWAVQSDPSLIEAQILLGQLFCSLGRPSDAEPHLLKAVVTQPGLRLLLANCYAARADKQMAATQAKAILSTYRAQAEGPALNEVATLACAQAYLHLDDYANAVSILRRGLSLSDSQAIRSLLAGAYAAWAQSHEQGAGPGQAARLRLLDEGLRIVPADSRLLQPLIELMKIKGADADQARSLLERMLTEGPPSALVHLLLGLDDWQCGKPEAAGFHLEQAHRFAPEAGLVANNLAWMLAHAASPDLPRALALADAAVASGPDNPHFRDTRGQILLKLERWKDAVADLEQAQRRLPEHIGLHAALATAYEKLGMPSIAQRHRLQAVPKPTR